MNKKAALNAVLTLCAVVGAPLVLFDVLFGFDAMVRYGAENYGAKDPGLALVVFTNWCLGLIIIVAVIILIVIVLLALSELYSGFARKDDEKEIKNKIKWTG